MHFNTETVLLWRYFLLWGDTQAVCIHYSNTNTDTQKGQKGDNIFYTSDIYYFPCMLINCFKRLFAVY